MKKELETKDQTENRESIWLTITGLIIFLSCVALAWIAYAAIIYHSHENWDSRGLSGDMFGGITALFSGLAFAGLIFTLLVQKQELKLQRLQLDQHREELSLLVDEQRGSKEFLGQQKEQLERQADYLLGQSFDNKLFAVFDLISSRLKSTTFISYEAKIMNGPKERTNIQGYEALLQLSERIFDKLEILEPHTESDEWGHIGLEIADLFDEFPVSVFAIAELVAYAGNMISQNPHLKLDDQQRYHSLLAAIVGREFSLIMFAISRTKNNIYGISSVVESLEVESKFPKLSLSSFKPSQ